MSLSSSEDSGQYELGCLSSYTEAGSQLQLVGNSSVLGEQHFQGQLSQASRTEKRTWDFIAGKALAASMDETVSASYHRKDTGTKALHTQEEPYLQLLDSLS